MKLAYFSRKLPYVDIRKYELDSNIIKLVPKSLAKKHCMIAVDRLKSFLILAIEHTASLDVKENIKDVIKKKLNFESEIIGTKKEYIEEKINGFY